MTPIGTWILLAITAVVLYLCFGAAGLILGPAIIALAMALGDVWSRRAAA